MSKHNKLYDEINDRIIEKLKSGVLPWRKSWKYGVPQNYITKRTYKGINYLNLCFEDFPSQYYLTYLQCKDKGGFVNKGAKSKSIIYWKISELENDGTVKRVPFLRLSNVFNLSQTTLYEGVEEEVGAAPSLTNCQEIIANISDKPIIKNNFNRCYYNQTDDYISIPRMSDFDSDGEYFSSLFHELAHYSGHSKRLNRFADNLSTAEEELVAELTSSYLCAVTGISNNTLDNQTAYLDSWISTMQGDSMFIVRASNHAKKASNWLLNYQHEQVNQSIAI
jgi:antirestriction protein ArdC